jgi:hypothetical protein
VLRNSKRKGTTKPVVLSSYRPGYRRRGYLKTGIFSFKAAKNTLVVVPSQRSLPAITGHPIPGVIYSCSTWISLENNFSHQII